MPKCYEAKDISEAVALADRFRREKRYDWFRGQRQQWPPYPSALRLKIAGDRAALEVARKRILMFDEWARDVPELKDLVTAGNVNHLFAVLQHYGVPTRYLDFTTNPDVAGFFASDGPPAEPGQQACIYCLNSEDLLDTWETVSELEARKGAQLELVRVDVTNLWRLQAQEGVFIYTNYNWDVDYPLDRIVFPNSSMPAPVPGERIYPSAKSPLEHLLDQYFSVERARLVNEELSRIVEEQKRLGRDNVGLHRWEALPGGVHAPAFRNPGELKPLDSWQGLEALGWHDYPEERFHEVVRGTETLRIPGDAAEPSGVVEAATRQRLAADPSLRMRAVEWVIEGAPATLDLAQLLPMLRRAWNGMRRLPYSDSDIAACFGRITLLAGSGYRDVNDYREREQHISRLLGPVQRVEFGTKDAAGAQAWVTTEALADCVRRDVDSLLADDQAWRARDIHGLLQVVHNPRLALEFDRLAKLFAREAIPMQVLDARKLIHFNPARLESFGNP
jgi:hypothetical protein